MRFLSKSMHNTANYLTPLVSFTLLADMHPLWKSQQDALNWTKLTDSVRNVAGSVHLSADEQSGGKEHNLLVCQNWWSETAPLLSSTLHISKISSIPNSNTLKNNLTSIHLRQLPHKGGVNNIQTQMPRTVHVRIKTPSRTADMMTFF